MQDLTEEQRRTVLVEAAMQQIFGGDVTINELSHYEECEGEVVSLIESNGKMLDDVNHYFIDWVEGHVGVWGNVS